MTKRRVLSISKDSNEPSSSRDRETVDAESKLE
jgi:hypothetical protein